MNTIGKYINGNSVMHKLDPRIKLITNIVFIVLVFLVQSFVMQAILLGTIVIAFFSSSISPTLWLKFKQMLKMLIPVITIAIFLFAINIFIIDGDDIHIYWKWKSIKISDKALLQTGLISMRIYTMIIITTILTATTKPTALTTAIEHLLFPLKLIRVPVHIIAMIISIALRFIPTLLEEAQRIMKAQASRGVDFKNGSPKTKAKATITLIIPIFVSAFGKAEDLANAMETRGYDPKEKRTRYRAYPIKFIDVMISIIVIGLIVATALYIHGFYPLPM